MRALLRWREPAVVVLLVLVSVRQLLVVGFALAALSGAAGPSALAGYAAAGEAGEPVALVGLAVLLATCHLAPATDRARGLTVLGMVAVALALLVQLVVAVLGLTATDLAQLPQPFRALNAVERLLGLVVPLLALLGLAVLLRGPAALSDLAESQPLPIAAAEAVPNGATTEVRPDPALQPTWQSDEAAGAVWLSAGDAASGRPPAAAEAVDDQGEPHPWSSGPR